jgi:hypothetical protein
MGFDPRSVQPVASRNIDYASPAYIIIIITTTTTTTTTAVQNGFVLDGGSGKHLQLTINI